MDPAAAGQCQMQGISPGPQKPFDAAVLNFALALAGEDVAVEDPADIVAKGSKDLVLGGIVGAERVDELADSAGVEVDGVGAEAFDARLDLPVRELIVSGFPGEMPGGFLVVAAGAGVGSVRVVRPVPDDDVAAAGEQGALAVRAS